MSRRRAIGFLVNDLVGSYQVSCWRGIEAEARARDWDLVCLAGGELGSSDQTKKMRNRAFDFARANGLDALVILAPALGNRLSAPEIAEWLAALRPIPAVSIGIELPGIPSILIDNDAGMRELVEHILGHHGRTHPLYLGGPERNPEAIVRRQAFRDVMTAHGLPLDPVREVIAEFDYGLGRDAVNSFYEKNLPLDCVIAANDEMALGAMEALQALGRSVPGNVLVAGFDDIEDSRVSSPPLATVRQPLEEQGRQAIQMLAAMLEGNQVPLIQTLPARFVPRRSCACLDRAITRVRAPREEYAGAPGLRLGDIEHQMRIDRLLEELHLTSAEFPFPILLAQALRDDTGSPQSHLTVDLVDSWARRIDRNDSETLQNFISDVRCESIPGTAEGAQRTDLESVLHQCRLVVSQLGLQASSWEAMQQERWMRAFHETSARLITSFEVAPLIEELSGSLNSLGIQSFYLLLSEGGNRLRLRLSHTGGYRDPIDPEGIIVLEEEVLQEVLGRSNARQTFTIDPLFFGDTAIGFIIFNLPPRRGALYDALRTQISASLRGAQLAREVVDQQRQLLLSEKMAGIGRLTAGIAHEMNTPLSAVRAAIEEARTLVEEYRDSIGDPEVTLDDHREIAADILKSLDISRRSAEKASAFVRSIKSQTRDMGSRDKAFIDLAPVIEEAVLLLSHASREAGVPIDVEIRDRPFGMEAIPDRVAQIVTNLLGNALDASQGRAGARVRLNAWIGEEGPRIEVSDDGCGIPKENLERIFEPLFTTKPVGKGTGLGLSIIHDLMESEFGGRVAVSSTVGVGSTFTLLFPRKEA